MRRPVRIRYLTGAARPEDLPALMQPRVAFLGRSNVGKSSLINRLTGTPGLARVSRTPGRTRLVNYFLLEDWLVLMDLPGYGHAGAARAQRAAWGPLSEAALRADGGAALSVLLLDGRHPVSPLDGQMAAWLDANGLPWRAVLTKCDKLKQAERAAAVRRAEPLPGGGPPLMTSARTGEGLAELWKEIVAAGRGRLRADRTGRAGE